MERRWGVGVEFASRMQVRGGELGVVGSAQVSPLIISLRSYGPRMSTGGVLGVRRGGTVLSRWRRPRGVVRSSVVLVHSAVVSA